MRAEYLDDDALTVRLETRCWLKLVHIQVQLTQRDTCEICRIVQILKLRVPEEIQ